MLTVMAHAGASRLLPLGGYVKMRGDENAASVPTAGASVVTGSFAAASVWARMAIVAAGPAANFIFGMMLFAGVYMGVGKAFIPPTIGEVIDGSAAQEAGLETGDRVMFVDGLKIDDFNTLRTIVFENPGRPLLFEVDRFDVRTSLTVTPKTVYSEQLKVDFGQLESALLKASSDAWDFQNRLFTPPQIQCK